MDQGRLDVRHSIGVATTSDGIDIAYQAWRPETQATAVLAVVHGYAEHGGRYALLAEHLTRHAFAVYACDLRGHGRSPGRRGHIRRFQEYHHDVQAFLGAIKRTDAYLPCYLTGHSMGGLVTTLYAAQRPDGLAGLVLSSPFFQLHMDVPAWKLAAARGLSRLAPAFTMPSDLNPEHLTHDREILERAAIDPLVHRMATSRWFTETTTAQRHIASAAAALKMPVLMLYSGEDRIVKAEVSEQFFASLASPDKSAVRYDGFYHEVFNEIDRERVFADLVDWLTAHTGGRTC